MPPLNSKNYALTPSVADLGLGDALQQQVEDETDEAKKKKAMLSKQSPFAGSQAVMALGLNTMS